MIENALIVGTGGIGTALAAALAGHARVEHVGRSTGFDIFDEAALAALAAALEPKPSLVIVTTGMLHDEHQQPEKSLRDLDADRLARSFAINAIAPALIAKHIIPVMPRHERSVFAVLGARVGSIADNRNGGWHGYRASKAALVQIVKTIAIEAARTRPHSIVVTLHPGTVDTGMSKPFQRGVDPEKLFSPETSAAHLLSVIEKLTPSDTGGPFCMGRGGDPGLTGSVHSFLWTVCEGALLRGRPPSMTIIEYNREKMVFNAIGCAMLAVLGGLAALQPDWHMQIRFVGGFLAITLPFVSLFLFLRIKSGAPAIAFDGQGVAISTFYRTRHCRWSDVRDIQRETLTQSSSFGLIKQEIGHYIVFTIADGAMYEELRVQEELLACKKQDVQALVDTMCGTWTSALHGTATSYGQAKPLDSLATTPTINGAPLRPQPTPGFGRKGL